MQNTSTAVMAQRSEPLDGLDDFPTPPWATRALLEHVIPLPICEKVWEPACGRGHMANTIEEYCNVWSSDIHDYGYGYNVRDFLGVDDTRRLKRLKTTDWIITNPPFNRAEEFVLKALAWTQKGAAIFVRTQFLEGIGRYEGLFKPHRPTIVAQFSERVSLVKGCLTSKGGSPTAYCWIVWIRNKNTPTRLMWIPPCKKELEKPEDYR